MWDGWVRDKTQFRRRAPEGEAFVGVPRYNNLVVAVCRSEANRRHGSICNQRLQPLNRSTAMGMKGSVPVFPVPAPAGSQYQKNLTRTGISTNCREIHRRPSEKSQKNCECNLTEIWILLYWREVGGALIRGTVC